MCFFSSFSGDAVRKRRSLPYVSFFLLILFTPGLPAGDREAAREAFTKAREYHDQLTQMSEAQRTVAQYERAIFLYRQVVDHDPTYGACDDALYFIGTIYDEMASRFTSDGYRKRAIYYYEFVAQQYPLTQHKRAALERAQHLKQVSAPAPAANPAAELATVSEIRYWSSDEYTRVVIQLDREVSFQKAVLENPYRIYFDLLNTRLNFDLVGKTYSVNDLFIKQIRVGENREGVVRIVLDFEKINKQTVFALYDPFRIVIDTRGASEPSRPEKKRTVKTAEAVISLDKASSRQEASREIPTVPSPNLSGTRSLTRVLGLKIGRVVVDPGHGGGDTGSIGPTGLREKDLVLDIAQRLKELLEKRLGTDVVLTRAADKFVPLEERTAVANQQGADLFVSIHANSSRIRAVSGVETFFLNFATNAEEREVASRENATSQKNIRDLEDLLRKIAFGDYIEESKDLAHVVQKSLYSQMKPHRPNLRNRGVKKAPFIVLIGSNMPSILTEVSFLSNPHDEKYLKTEEGRDRLAEALYKGIESYFRSLGAVPLQERVTSETSP